MLDEEPSSGPPDVRWDRIALAAMFGGLALLLLVRPGCVDEVEHLHIAWLMAVRGLRPIDDFFEHHTPLLWHLLGLFYRAGANGPEVLYAARVLVIGLTGLWCVSLARVQQRLAGAQRFGAWLSFLLFGAFVVVLEELVVTRPETLALALFGLAAWAMVARSRPLLWALLAGALGALSAVASPRFALLLPALLLLAPPGQLGFAWKRLGALALGGATAFAVCVATILPLRDLAFDLTFSTILQQVGIQTSFDMRFLGASVGAAGAAIGVALACHARPRRRELVLWLSHGALIWFACARSSGIFPYPQAFAPGLIWSCLFVAWLESHPLTPGARPIELGLVIGASFGLVAGSSVLIAYDTNSRFGVRAMTESRRMLLDTLPAGARVVMFTAYHPITVDDAGYWGSIVLDDAPGRLCLAFAAYHQLHPEEARMPPCSLLAIFRATPPLITTRRIQIAAVPEEENALEDIVDRDYAPDERLDEASNRAFGVQVLRHR